MFNEKTVLLVASNISLYLVEITD